VRQYQLSHLSDGSLLSGLRALLARDHGTTAEILAHVAEFDERKLYLPAAYPSMFAYCVGELHLSEEAAFKRIHAARAARRFPAIFTAVAEGRLHLSAVVMLAPHLTEENAEELLTAATHRTKAQIERILAERFPRPDVLAWVREIPASSTAVSIEHLDQHAPGRVEPAPGPVQPPTLECHRPRVKALAPQRFALQCTIDQETHDLLRYAQELLSHQVPPGDISKVLGHVLRVAIPRLEKSKFAATSKPRMAGRCAGRSHRHIPAHVRRAVWERDGAQCTFVSDHGRRCEARSRLEFDHIHEVSRGGESTVSGIRLRCRAHNQYAAECTFGAGFMSRKRCGAQRVREQIHEQARDLMACLRTLGFRAEEVRRAAAVCGKVPDLSLEERVRLALSYLRPQRRGIHCAAP